MFEYAKGVFCQCAAFFHDVRFLFHPLFVTIDDHFMFPTVNLFDNGFFAQTLLAKRALATIRGLAFITRQSFTVFLMRFAAGG